MTKSLHWIEHDRHVVSYFLVILALSGSIGVSIAGRIIGTKINNK